MKYELYINDQLCDLNDDSIISLTYTMELLTNPTAVRNTYSHEVSLPQTPRNDKIFNALYRSDYLDNGDTFSPMEQVPFAIYNEAGERAERGYIKVSSIKMSKDAHTYAVTLFGGLGSFFYAMAYNDDGEALKLGDLTYLTGYDNERLLDFSISRGAVSGAWKRLAGDNVSRQYDVLNFAPTYQGVPESGFDASKAIYVGQATASGGDTLRNPIYGITQPNNGYKMHRRYVGSTDTMYRFALVDLGEEKTEWEMKDLRSYMQRPVLRVRKFFEAVQKRATAHGYTLTLDSAFFNEGNPYYNDTWMTLPSLQTLTRSSGEKQLSIYGDVTIGGEQSSIFALGVNEPSLDNTDFGVDIKDVSVVLPNINVRLGDNTQGENFHHITQCRMATGLDANVWFMQAYGTRNGNVVIVSDIVALCDERGKDEDFARFAACKGYTPKNTATPTPLTFRNTAGSFAGEGNRYTHGDIVTFSERNIAFKFPISSAAEQPDTWYIKIDKYQYKGGSAHVGNLWCQGVRGSEGYHPYEAVAVVDGEPVNAYGTATISASQNARSGSLIRKEELFDIGHSPMEVMLSYSKLFGLVWHYDAQRNHITLMPRSSFYEGGVALDWSNRIDHAKDMSVVPFTFDKRFYDFELETNGAWAEEYAHKYGKTYGAQRVNTGYNFDNVAKNLLDGSALKGGAEVLEQSKYYCNIVVDGKVCPSVFIDGGKYRLYKDSENSEFDITRPQGGIEYLNELQGYDYLPKLQMHADGKLVEDCGTLLLHVGNIEIDSESPYRNLMLTDDQPEMSLLNDGTPCWVLEGSAIGSLDGETIPQFVRAGNIGGRNVSLDMGVPMELDNPNADTTAVEASIYSQYWSKYLADRYNKNSRVMTAYVDLRGVQVSNALFRNFYYFDNAWWVLNKINNYAITAESTTQCEFVKVQDKNNYK